VFRSAGYLAREQVYPVGLVLWQLLRILCIGASHLSNLVDRFKNKGKLPFLHCPLKQLADIPQQPNKQTTNSTP